MILNVVTKHVDLPECPKYFFRLSQVVNTSSSFKIILNGVTKLVDILDDPRYF